MPYVYRWDRCGRKGHLCKVTARGTMNSCRVEFEDGFVMITSRNALKKATHRENDGNEAYREAKKGA